jgi:hypothetical protein
LCLSLLSFLESFFGRPSCTGRFPFSLSLPTSLSDATTRESHMCRRNFADPVTLLNPSPCTTLFLKCHARQNISRIYAAASSSTWSKSSSSQSGPVYRKSSFFGSNHTLLISCRNVVAFGHRITSSFGSNHTLLISCRNYVAFGHRICRSGFMTLPPVPLQEQPAMLLLLEGALVSWLLAMRKYGGHEDLCGSGRRSVIPYVHR